MFQPKDSAVAAQQLRVQELSVTSKEPNLYVIDTGHVVIIINEVLARAVLCLSYDDSAATLTPVTQANLILSDSTTYAAGGDKKAIRINTVTSLDAGDCLVLKYIIDESA